MELQGRLELPPPGFLPGSMLGSSGRGEEGNARLPTRKLHEVKQGRLLVTGGRSSGQCGSMSSCCSWSCSHTRGLAGAWSGFHSGVTGAASENVHRRTQPCSPFRVLGRRPSRARRRLGQGIMHCPAAHPQRGHSMSRRHTGTPVEVGREPFTQSPGWGGLPGILWLQ